MTDKPSIAELQLAYDRDTFTDEAKLIDAVPVLLEIAAAALAWAGSECETQSCDTDDYTEAAKRNECAGDTHDERCPVDVATRRLASALSKVRP